MNKLTLAEDHLYGLNEYGDTDVLEAIPDDLANLIAFARVVRDAMNSSDSDFAILDQIQGALYELENS